EPALRVGVPLGGREIAGECGRHFVKCFMTRSTLVRRRLVEVGGVELAPERFAALERGPRAGPRRHAVERLAERPRGDAPSGGRPGGARPAGGAAGTAGSATAPRRPAPVSPTRPARPKRARPARAPPPAASAPKSASARSVSPARA